MNLFVVLVLVLIKYTNTKTKTKKDDNSKKKWYNFLEIWGYGGMVDATDLQ